jgi:DNA-directed RNA polymerase subunit RPC12/RpoP
MNLVHHNRNVCDQCGEKFEGYEELISHARHVHHHTIVKCHECGKEFIHEKDRLHHVREEHQQKVEPINGNMVKRQGIRRQMLMSICETSAIISEWLF